MSQIVACRMRGMVRRNILHAEARDYGVSEFYENVLWESYLPWLDSSLQTESIRKKKRIGSRGPLSLAGVFSPAKLSPKLNRRSDGASDVRGPGVVCLVK
ncbi:hypothetical protein Q7P37_005505 [Cladosporium fusiforme]